MAAVTMNRMPIADIQFLPRLLPISSFHLILT
jgi:hypothetical protein